MRFISEEELKSITNGKGIKAWLKSDIKRHYSEGKAYYSPALKGTILFECLRCKSRYIHDKCNNCGGNSLECGESEKQLGVFCKACKRGFTTWSCEKCGTENPSGNTLFTKMGCFVATACYGDYDAPEVMVLRQFRDEILQKNPVGRIFTCLYYAVSPPVADFIASHEFLKKIVRQTLIAPSVDWATKRLKPMKKES